MNLYELYIAETFKEFNSPIRSTSNLTRVRIVDAEFDNPDGSPMTLDTDYFNEKNLKPQKPDPLIN